MQVVQIKAQPRTETGKKAAKAIRKQGLIPAVLYSHKGVTHFTTSSGELKSLVYTPDFKLAEIEIEGSARKAILKSIDFHPVSDEITHVDFLELNEGTTIKVEIPIKTIGVSPGVKSGGKLIKTLRAVKVKVTPEKLVDTLTVDISKLKLGGVVRVNDILVPDGISLLVDGAIPVANVAVPRALKGDAEVAVDEEAVETGEEGADSAAEAAN